MNCKWLSIITIVKELKRTVPYFWFGHVDVYGLWEIWNIYSKASHQIFTWLCLYPSCENVWPKMWTGYYYLYLVNRNLSCSEYTVLAKGEHIMKVIFEPLRNPYADCLIMSDNHNVENDTWSVPALPWAFALQEWRMLVARWWNAVYWAWAALGRDNGAALLNAIYRCYTRLTGSRFLALSQQYVALLINYSGQPWYVLQP